MEEYMAQYGYRIPPPLPPALFDVFSRVTPAAAGDLPAPAAGDISPAEGLVPETPSGQQSVVPVPAALGAAGGTAG